MTLSLNEVEATAKKAARGAGYPWGLAEEAGKATRWLCAHGLDGCAHLAGLLGQVDDASLARWYPQLSDGHWSATGGRLCPIATGAALSDLGLEALSAAPAPLGPLAEPALLLPFLARLAQSGPGGVLTLSLPGGTAATDGAELVIDAPLPRSAEAARVKIGGTPCRPAPRSLRADPAPQDWADLNRLAHKTYAPATDASRDRGAGAGLSDND